MRRAFFTAFAFLKFLAAFFVLGSTTEYKTHSFLKFRVGGQYEYVFFSLVNHCSTKVIVI